MCALLMMTSHKKVPTKDELKRAITYLEAALDMEKKKYVKVPVIPSNPPRHTDSLAWGYVVVGYFLVEEAFKFLKIARGETYRGIHNLSCLFSELDPADQNVLHEYYRDFRCACECAKNFPKAKILDFLNELDAGRKDDKGSLAWRYSLIEESKGISLPLVSVEFLHEIIYGAIKVARHIINPSTPSPARFTYSQRKDSERRRAHILRLEGLSG